MQEYNRKEERRLHFGKKMKLKGHFGKSGHMLWQIALNLMSIYLWPKRTTRIFSTEDHLPNQILFNIEGSKFSRKK